ncbi:hypothetical protein [Rhodococcus sp. 1168]|uniref:hypothetical protein n=1 Tax=Rhodococcus sp. 1168 TaxID=2018041 RepID=UPI000A09A1E1|nr:hypothetical protein [Rhodococcus sp. 1168]ORI21170.1 hypothetical protein BJI47_17160 [Rhodococcus sp. 1168]
MRRLKVFSFMAASLLLMSAACGEDGGETTKGPDAVASSSAVDDDDTASAAQRAPAGNPCDGTRGLCEVVASVDVDGDGNSDNVAIELVDGLVNVHIDTGGTVSTASVEDKHILRSDITPSNVFVGAYHITREQGADIVVDGKFGLGGSELFGVIGWDDGPVVIPAPPVLASDFDDATAWTVPTEGLRVLVRCPQPGSVGVVTTEGDSSYGTPTPGGAYTETVTSDWANGEWAEKDTNRVSGEYTSSNRLAKTGTFECEPMHSAPPAFAPTVSDLDPNIVLGGRPPSYSDGYGETTPVKIYFGGSPSGLVSDIVWDSWGGERATGHGNAFYVVDSVADAEMMPAEVIAYDISTCNTRRAYSTVQWYFPSLGEDFDPALGNDVC